jgi:deoxyinosine 3'endonuclease (endonuclease V)
MQVAAMASSAWVAEQLSLKEALVTRDDLGFSLEDGEHNSLSLVGGVDISFVGNESDIACAALVVLEYPSMREVYSRYRIVRLQHPYVSGFLAFREVPFRVELVEELRRAQPELIPQIIFVDGNGVLHPRGFGLASHLGVLVDIPTVGVGKSLLKVDGLEKQVVLDQCKATLTVGGEWLPLVGEVLLSVAFSVNAFRYSFNAS